MLYYKKILTERPIMSLAMISLLSLVVGFSLVLQSNNSLTYNSRASDKIQVTQKEPSVRVFTCLRMDLITPPGTTDYYFSIRPTDSEPHYYVQLTKNGKIILDSQYGGKQREVFVKVRKDEPGIYQAYVSRTSNQGFVTNENCKYTIL